MAMMVTIAQLSAALRRPGRTLRRYMADRGRTAAGRAHAKLYRLDELPPEWVTPVLDWLAQATAEPPPEVEYAPSPGAAGAAPTSPAGGEVGERPSFRVRLVKIRPKLRLVGPLAGTEG